MQNFLFLILALGLFAACHSENYSVKGCPKLSTEDLEKFNSKVAEIRQKVNNQLTIEHQVTDGCETRTVKRSGS